MELEAVFVVHASRGHRAILIEREEGCHLKVNATRVISDLYAGAYVAVADHALDALQICTVDDLADVLGLVPGERGATFARLDPSNPVTDKGSCERMSLDVGWIF